jgi:hypothetical protein
LAGLPSNHSTEEVAMDANACIPELVIRVPFEGRPEVYLVSASEGEEQRLWTWLNDRDDVNLLIESALQIEASA